MNGPHILPPAGPVPPRPAAPVPVDQTNCAREPIHLAGAIQPHGVLLLLQGPAPWRLAGASANLDRLLASTPAESLGQALATLAPALDLQVGKVLAAGPDDEPMPLQLAAGLPGLCPGTAWEGALHRVAGDRLVVELEPVPNPGLASVGHDRETLTRLVGEAVERLGRTASIGALADVTARCLRDLLGHDRVMVYKFDADGHGEVISEARDPRLEPLLGHHYPASDIPPQARALYLLNRVRVLPDVAYTPVPLLDAQGQPLVTGLDMSMCYLRSMSPMHLQYLQNMGVTATVVVSLVREGQLWGLIAAHHHAPRNVRYALRAACDLLGEVVSTRIAAIENYAHAQVAVLVRRLEQRLVEATSSEGDWRLALFRNPRTLLQPLDATGAALFAEGEVLTAGEVPSTPELRALQQWLAQQPADERLFATSSIARAEPALDSLTPVASGVLSVRLSAGQPDLLVWLRKEQLHTVTWGGDPNKPMLGTDPLQMGPRQSFAAWSELVRGTATPWTTADLALARAFGQALSDMVTQVQAVRLLVAEHQLAGIRAAVREVGEPVMVTDGEGRVIFCNPACQALTGDADTAQGAAQLADTRSLAERFEERSQVQDALDRLVRGQSSWRGELTLRRRDGSSLPVLLRAESVPGRQGRPLGLVLNLVDLRESRRTAEVRQHFEASLQRAMQLASAGLRLHPAADGAAAEARRAADPLLGAILTNASLAAMDIAEGAQAHPVAPLLQSLEQSTRRATALYERLLDFSQPPPEPRT